jgi:hypothetical protein
MKSLRAQISVGNVLAFTALLVALGGVSYAALEIPNASVGTAQLQNHSVTRKKLAKHSVRKRALAKKLQAGFGAAPATGGGAQGPAGPQGPGAGRIHASLTGVAAPTATPVLAFQGLHIAAKCELSGGMTAITTIITSDTDATLQDNFNNDTGSDPHTPSPIQSGTIQFDLQAGVALTLPSPPVASPDYFRTVANAVYVTQGKTITFTAASVVDAAANHCALDGVAVLAS